MRNPTNSHEVRVLRPSQRQTAAKELLTQSKQKDMPKLYGPMLKACRKAINSPRPQDALDEGNDEVRVLIYQRTSIKLAMYTDSEQSHLFAIMDNDLNGLGWRVDRKECDSSGLHANGQAKVWLVLKPLSVFVPSAYQPVNLDEWEYFGLVDALYVEQLREEVSWDLGKRFLVGADRRWDTGRKLIVSYVRGAEGKGELLLLERDGKIHQYLMPGSPRHPVDKIMSVDAFKHLQLSRWKFPSDQ